jgi:hypothetical protein
VPAPEVVRHRRHGEHVILTWQWPPQVSEIEVSWPLPGETHHRQPVSATRYEAEGGAVVTPPRGTTVEISVTPVVVFGQRRQLGESRIVTVEMPAQAGYTIRFAGPWWRRRAVARISVRQAVRIRRLVLILARGTRMPLRIADGEILQEGLDIDVTPDAPVIMESPVRGLARPFWLRCFAEGHGVELEDPPREQLYARGRR